MIFNRIELKQKKNKKKTKNRFISLEIIWTCQKMLILMVEIEKLH